ncbi:hypothetical protein [Sinomonas sp. G460-2]|uniref:hypothetical protein n=1 Tax=Sinomonas sp. G460-2 TaxID=3393464 RepID=UPI0039F1494E
MVSLRWIGEDAPFNRIGGRARVGDGFTLHMGTGSLSYRVAAVASYTKASLASSSIWDIYPGRVVLITCDQTDPWGKNTVIAAEPTASR